MSVSFRITFHEFHLPPPPWLCQYLNVYVFSWWRFLQHHPIPLRHYQLSTPAASPARGTYQILFSAESGLLCCMAMFLRQGLYTTVLQEAPVKFYPQLGVGSCAAWPCFLGRGGILCLAQSIQSLDFSTDPLAIVSSLACHTHIPQKCTTESN